MSSYACVTCKYSGKDNYDLERHMKTSKHLENVKINLSTELKDIRLMTKAEEDEYIFNHPYYREKDGELYKAKLIEKEYHKAILLKEQWKPKSVKQLTIDLKKIDEEYGLASDEELEETSEAFEERWQRRQLAVNEGSYDELKKIQDVIDIYNSNLFKHVKIYNDVRIRKVKDAVRYRITAELEAKQAAEEAIKRQAEIEAAKLDRMKRELELKMEMAMLKMKK
jgi:hypothetical protein